MDERSARIEQRFQTPMLIAALLVIPTFVVEENGSAGTLHTLAVVLDYAIWSAFLVELVVMLRLVPDRRQWLVRHPVELVVVVLTPPFLLAALAPVRALRLLRMLRLLRIVPLIRRLRALQRAVARARAAAADLEGDEAGEAYARVLTPVLDRAISQMLREAAASSARQALRQSLGGDWDRLGERSQDLMIAAEVLRGDLEEYSAIDPGFDFATAVHAYSRAIENAVLEALFDPLRGSDTPLPADTGRSAQDKSLAVLRGLRDDGKSPELGTMGHCLKNVGCRMADAPDNGFAVLLESRLVDRASFCAGFPSELLRYATDYRNKAAHVERMTVEQCAAARAVLVEEPVRLLRVLVGALR